MRHRKTWGFALALAGLPSLGGCASQPDHWVELKGRRFTVEIADDDAERARGLMFRDNMARDAGMLFVFEHEQPLAFWMKNTRIPLDIFYFDGQRRLVSTAAGVPPCRTPQCPAYPSSGPGRFVLELNAGLARELAVMPGDEITFSPDITKRYMADTTTSSRQSP